MGPVGPAWFERKSTMTQHDKARLYKTLAQNVDRPATSR